jgi:hypothetical protein
MEAIDDIVSHFAAVDEEVGDEAELPWPASGWIEGDTLAPPCGSDINVITAMLSQEFAAINASDVLLDLGAGDGRVCIQAIAQGARGGWGIEIDPIEVSKFKANIIKFKFENICSVTEGDLSLITIDDLIEKGVTVISIYLLPEAIQLIKPLLNEALARNLRIVANTWGLVWLTPTKSIRAGENSTPLFLYEPCENKNND